MKKRRKIVRLLAPIIVLFFAASCDLKNQNKQLTFTLTEEKDGYIVSEINQNIAFFEENYSIVIPNKYRNLPVIGIGNEAFKNCSSLASITIPNSVVVIGSNAFKNCNKLTSVEIPNSVMSIGKYAFEGCSSLKSMEIPSSVTNIGEGAFYYCTSLVSMNIPNSVTSIKNDTFYRCNSLSTIDIANGVKSIGERAFESCNSLTSFNIPNGVTSIENEAFKDCYSLTSITIPNSVISIGEGAFKGCTSLESITIPFVGAELNGTQYTNFGYIFGTADPNFQSNYIPIHLKSVTITGGNFLDELAFNACYYITTMVVITDGSMTIGYETFKGCSSLTIFCNASSESEWNDPNITIYWNEQWSYVDGVPTPIQE